MLTGSFNSTMISLDSARHKNASLFWQNVFVLLSPDSRKGPKSLKDESQRNDGWRCTNQWRLVILGYLIEKSLSVVAERVSFEIKKLNLVWHPFKRVTV